MPHDDQTRFSQIRISAYPPLDLRPREAARLAEQPCPPIAGGAHPDQWARPYGHVISNSEAPDPLAPHRR